MGARLVAIGASVTGGFHLNAGRVSIGSAAENACIVSHATVSRRHATLELRDGAWMLSDDRSSNGTFVNGRRIVGTTQLRDGDQLRFGAAAYLMLIDPVPAARAKPASATRTLAIVLAVLVTGAFATTLFLVNFDRLESTGLGGSPALAPVSPAPLTATAAPTSAMASASTPAAGPAPTAEPSGLEESGSVAWLYALDQYRFSVRLPAVTVNQALTPGCEAHSRYVVKNYGNRIASETGIGAAIHSEDPAKPGYSKAGLIAARDGTVDEMYDPGGIAEPTWAIDDWMRAPFHRMALLGPHLRSVGYGEYCEKGFCIATMNVRSDTTDSPGGVGALAAPIAYPPYDGTITETAFNGEWPDPLTSCPGYARPAGYPITLELGSVSIPDSASYSLIFSGKSSSKLDACLIIPGTYTNPDPTAQSVTRGILRHYGALVLIPRLPLETGKYSVAFTTGSHTYSWSFSVKP